jgi:hypothetical protein
VESYTPRVSRFFSSNQHDKHQTAQQETQIAVKEPRDHQRRERQQPDVH